MEYLFYLLFALNILHELPILLDPSNHIKLMEDIKAKKFTSPEFQDKPLPEKWPELFSLFWLLGTQLLYFLLTIIGLFSFQWWAFLVFFCWSVLTGSLMKNSFNHTLKYAWYRLDALVSLTIIIFVILNAFHFHISFADILNYIN